MPYCDLHTNKEMNPAGIDILLRELSKTVAEMLEKPEKYVMVRVSAGEKICFGGSTETACVVSLASLGLPETRTAEFSSTLTRLIESQIGVPADRCYIEFQSPPRHMWGYNGGTFG